MTHDDVLVAGEALTSLAVTAPQVQVRSLLACLVLVLMCTVGWAQQKASPWYGGVTLETAGRRGFAAGLTANYQIKRGFAATAELRWSGIDYPQVKCLATDIDTLALLSGSQYYLGDEHYVSNLVSADRAEALAGVRLAGGGRFKFLVSFQLGYRLQQIRSEVSSSPQVRSIFGCGSLGIDENGPSGPRELSVADVFESTAGSGVGAFGLGLQYDWASGLRTSLQLMSRHYFYGDARFRVRDPRQPGNGSQILRLRDHAASNEIRLQASLLVPLRMR